MALFKILLCATLIAKYCNAYDDQSCVCVPYWQCKEDNSGLIEDGIEIIDIRRRYSGNTDYDDFHCPGDFDVCCEIECGKRVTNIIEDQYAPSNRLYSDIGAFRILGNNNEAEFGEFPWMLGILQNKAFVCGGSLIHPRVAITAAHCIRETNTYNIRAGEYNWQNQNEPLPHQDRLSKKIIIHPRYHAGSLRNDMALIIVDKPFKLTENVGISCIPKNYKQFDSSRCIATGWGKNNYKNGEYQTTLKKTDLPIVPHYTCLKSLQDARLGPYFHLHGSFICAGGESNKDTCKGDGGSPLVCPLHNQPDKYEQVGIVSWGLTCGLRSVPGVYVNVALFSDWIDQEMIKHGFNTKIYRNRQIF